MFAVVCGLLAGFGGLSVRASELVWSEDIEASLRQAASDGRPVLMEFTASWCVYCKRMEKSTFVDPAVISRISENFVAVRVDADKHKDLVAELGIKGLPAILIVSPELQIQERISGFQTAEALVAKLDQVTSRSASPAADQTPAVNARTTAGHAPGRGARHAAPSDDLADFEQPATQDQSAAARRKGIHPVSRAAEPAESDPSSAAARHGEFEFGDEPAEAPAAEQQSDEFLESIRRGSAGEPSEFAQDSGPAETRTAAVAAAAAGHSRARSKASAPAFAGQCLVSAVEDRELIPGTSRSQIEYHGKLLYFRSEGHKQRFLANPDKYWPMLDGNCAMTLLNEDVSTEGQLQFAAVFRKQIWLFTSEQHMKDFLADPAEVVDEIADRTAEESGR